MPRTVGFVALTILVGAAPVAAFAQPGTPLPKCDKVAITSAAHSGIFPNLLGCPSAYANAANQLLNQRYKLVISRSAVAHVRPGTVIGQSQEGRVVRLSIAIRPSEQRGAPQPNPDIPTHVIAKGTPARPAAQQVCPDGSTVGVTETCPALGNVAGAADVPAAGDPKSAEQPTPAAAPIGAQTAAPDPPGHLAAKEAATHQIALPPNQPVVFSISNAAAVEEGKPLTFQISRTGNDGRVHHLKFKYSNTDLLVQPTGYMLFEPADPPEKDLVVETAAGKPGDGDHTVQVQLGLIDDVAKIADPGTATGTIVGAAAPPPPKEVIYTIAADGPAKRGPALKFTISRTGPLDAATLQYNFAQQDGDVTVSPAAPSHVDFRQGEDHVGLVINSGQYSVCEGPVTVTLGDQTGTHATVAFHEPPPAECGGSPLPWWKQLLLWITDHLPLVIGGAVLAGAGLLNWYFRPFAAVHPSCEIEPGNLAFTPSDNPVSRWPEVTTDVDIEPGDCHVTQPLTRLEQANG